MKDNKKNHPMDVQDLIGKILSLSRRQKQGLDSAHPGGGEKGNPRPHVPAALSGRVCADSRRVEKGDVFVAVKGASVDGHDYIPQALANGAAVIVVEKTASSIPRDVPIVKVRNSALVLGELAQAWAGETANSLTKLAVTGTNGKTTVAYLVRSILNQAGLPCGMIGTVEYDLGRGLIAPAGNTTPGAVELADILRQMGENDLKAVVMECSSHGLDQGRVAGIDFAAAAFTNLSGDHQDYHGSMQRYLEAKSRLFTGLREHAIAVINVDDPAGNELAALAKGRIWRYGFDIGLDISAVIENMSIKGCRFELTMFGEKTRIQTPLTGRHNVFNCLAAAGLAKAAGLRLTDIKRGLESFTGVPGRLERIETGRPFTVCVDYAHTDDALDHVLRSLHQLKENRLLVVFGCGGDRDQSKRPRMAAVAERWADRIVLTSDNPRTEDPVAILEHIRAGFSREGLKKVTERPDRRAAIAWALKHARTGDVVLIAGKGHEDYQVIGTQKKYFDDRSVVREILHDIT